MLEREKLERWRFRSLFSDFLVLLREKSSKEGEICCLGFDWSVDVVFEVFGEALIVIPAPASAQWGNLGVHRDVCDSTTASNDEPKKRASISSYLHQVILCLTHASIEII